jgi:hypothetical protein
MTAMSRCEPKRGPRVDLAAVAFDVSRDLAEPAVCGPLEEHVLMQVRQPELLGLLVGGAGLDPDLNRHHRGRALWGVNPGKAVIELEAHEVPGVEEVSCCSSTCASGATASTDSAAEVRQ